MYLDYQDDGQIFNGSIGCETYLAAALLGGIIGGVLGYYAGPTIASLLANPRNISLASLVFAGDGSTGGLTISVAAVGQIALAGAISTTAIGTIGATYMFSKNARRFQPKDNRANKAQNEKFKRIADEYNLTKDQRRRLHDKISKRGYNVNEIIELIKRLFSKYNK